jgi:hypothetical protein
MGEMAGLQRLATGDALARQARAFPPCCLGGPVWRDPHLAARPAEASTTSPGHRETWARAIPAAAEPGLAAQRVRWAGGCRAVQRPTAAQARAAADLVTLVLPCGTNACRTVPLRDVQEAASHADPRTTMRYDRARGSLDRHATYIVAAYVAGAAR